MKIGLSSDSSCTLYGENAARNDVSIFPLNVIVDGIEYLDGINITHSKLSDDMKNGKTIKTSTPPPQEVVDYFNNLFEKGYDYIIHFTISSKLSSMFNLFKMISKDYFNDKVIVIDSLSICTLMSSHIFYTRECIKENMAIDEIKLKLKERINNEFIVFIPENLTALKNGGRIPPALATIGNLIGLKPILLLVDGELKKDSTTRNIKKTMNEIIPNLIKKYPMDKFDYCIHSFNGDQKTIEFINNLLISNNINTENKIFPIALNICAHCGPGTIGILISQKINGQSINNFLY